MKPLLRAPAKNNEFVYFETKESRPCTICRPGDPDYNTVSPCRAFEVEREVFLTNKLNTRVYTDCLQHLQNWVLIKRGNDDNS